MGSKWLPVPPLRRGLLGSAVRERRARRKVEESWAARRQADGSPIEPGLVVSLTSHAPRFGTLALTLKSLLLQTICPEAVVLWIGHGDMASLPAEVRRLETAGLQIRACEDHGPHTKYVHALREWPDHRVAICDDDIYYRPDWLGHLVAADRPGQVACHRIHRIMLESDGLPKRYRLWEHDSPARDGSPLNVPTGVGGALLRLARFDPQVLDIELARSLCPTTDDLWLYAMGRLAGTCFRLDGPYDPLIVWRTSQDNALWRTNLVERANDRAMAVLMERFGAGSLFGAADEWLAA